MNDPNGPTEEQWVLKLLSKFQLDLMVNEAEVVIFLK